MSAILEFILTSPNCSAATRLEMPTDACLFFYECTNCSFDRRRDDSADPRFRLVNEGCDIIDSDV